MNKQEFLAQLERHLKTLSPADRADIISDQDAYISDAVRSGRTEASVIAGLGDPKIFAHQLLAELNIQRIEDSKKISEQAGSVFRAIFAMLALAPFNLIFILGPFLVSMAVLISGWALSSASIIISFIVLMAFFFVGLFIPVGFLVHLSAFFLLIGLIGISILLLVVMWFLSKTFFKILGSYLKWNLGFIIGKQT